jgi:four helix bundle protein
MRGRIPTANSARLVSRLSGKLEHFVLFSRGSRLAFGHRVTKEELKHRTKAFGIAAVKFGRSLPTDAITGHFALQLAKSATSVGANYRSSCRAKSRADFISKMTTVEDEGDEALFWLEVLVETETVPKEAVAPLIDEADQLVRIVVASINTARGGDR